MKRRGFFRCALALVGLKALGSATPIEPSYRVIHFGGCDTPEFAPPEAIRDSICTREFYSLENLEAMERVMKLKL